MMSVHVQEREKELGMRKQNVLQGFLSGANQSEIQT